MITRVEDSIIITILLSLMGMVWAVISYTLFTKWICWNGEGLKDRLLQCLVDNVYCSMV